MVKNRRGYHLGSESIRLWSGPEGFFFTANRTAASWQEGNWILTDSGSQILLQAAAAPGGNPDERIQQQEDLVCSSTDDGHDKKANMFPLNRSGRKYQMNPYNTLLAANKRKSNISADKYEQIKNILNDSAAKRGF